MPCRGSCSWRSAASTRASIPLKSKGGCCCCSSTGFSLRMPCIPNGGCRGEGALNRRIANHRKRLPITRGSMLLLLLFLQVLGEDADEPLVIAPHVTVSPTRGSCAFCSTRANILLMAKSHYTGGRCAMCDVWRVSLCDVCRVSLKIKKSNTKMVYRPALRRRARSGAAPARRRATPLCKKTRGGEINT